MDTKTLVALIIAAYGAALSTIIALAKGISWWHSKKPRLKVTISSGLMLPSSGRLQIIITAVNKGENPIQVQSGGIEVSGGTFMALRPNSNPTIPCQLDYAQNIHVWFDAGAFCDEATRGGMSGTIKIKGIINTSLGKSYRSKAMKIDMAAVDRYNREL